LALLDWVARSRSDSRATAKDSSDVSVMSNLLENLLRRMF
jgi:hypothetical protein